MGNTISIGSKNILVMDNNINVDTLLNAYANGIFPMAENAQDKTFYWVEPKTRGVIPLETFHVPKRLRRIVKQNLFDITVNTDFNEVLNQCAARTLDRKDTWINQTIKDIYGELHKNGFAHSVECRIDGELVGGLYGVHLQSAFFGESMFSRYTNASKVALVYLVERLRTQQFMLLDAQFMNEHLKQFGAVEIDQQEYLKQLRIALNVNATF